MNKIQHILTWMEMPEGVPCTVVLLDKCIGDIASHVQTSNDKIEQIKGHVKAQTK